MENLGLSSKFRRNKDATPRSQLFLLFLAMINKRGNYVMQMPAMCFRRSAESPACSPKSCLHGLPVSI